MSTPIRSTHAATATGMSSNTRVHVVAAAAGSTHTASTRTGRRAVRLMRSWVGAVTGSHSPPASKPDRGGGLPSPLVSTVDDRRTENSTGSGPSLLKPRSYEVTDGITRAPARAMLRAVGMGDDDWDKPQIGVASSWNEITPCNLSLRRLADRAKEGVHAAGGFPLEFGTIHR